MEKVLVAFLLSFYDCKAGLELVTSDYESRSLTIKSGFRQSYFINKIIKNVDPIENSCYHHPATN